MEIVARDLVKTYRGGTRALAGVSLELSAGETIAVTGPSGSGKSTLLSLLGGLEPPTSGEVWVDGQPLASRKPLERFRAERIGFVFQFHHLLPHLTLLENVELPMIPLGVSARERRIRAADILARAGIESLASRRPGRVSGGERQRCAVARALVNEPDVLLADEPSGNLDSETGRRLMDLMLAWARERGATVILATHDAELAGRAERRSCLQDGRIVERGEGCERS